ncbi:thymidine phosphorylase-like isoform X2 [Gigantopelta aegis]|uniref:thymidine phosphorylase-like isoform X2 n=1 Tax=Gigantopelta aegis TaxID=1735272 RepID=UPI001B88871D|nr:thymidine phosphorylase-like isoform X2 [Gigantopelta aegis]
MISGRGLEHTGGTLDKLESIPGFQVSVTTGKMLEILGTVGCCIVGQTQNLCPADKVIYSIRDVTATVNQIGLITASIISKKAAEKLDALVLDVKFGLGAFRKDENEARTVAQLMI